MLEGAGGEMLRKAPDVEAKCVDDVGCAPAAAASPEAEVLLLNLLPIRCCPPRSALLLLPAEEAVAFAFAELLAACAEGTTEGFPSDVTDGRRAGVEKLALRSRLKVVLGAWLC